jgi:hypothetical protein
MGYNTTYSLTWAARPGHKVEPSCRCKGNPTHAKFCATCGTPIGFTALNYLVAKYIEDHNVDENSDMSYCLEPDGTSSEPCKWYEHVEEMKKMSLAFPNVLFTLAGEGEESGDVWRKYFLNGKVQVSKIKMEFDPFDPIKLV